MLKNGNLHPVEHQLETHLLKTFQCQMYFCSVWINDILPTTVINPHQLAMNNDTYKKKNYRNIWMPPPSDKRSFQKDTINGSLFSIQSVINQSCFFIEKMKKSKKAAHIAYKKHKYLPLMCSISLRKCLDLLSIVSLLEQAQASATSML